MMKREMKKTWHHGNFRLEYEGRVWYVNVAVWVEQGTTKGELRVYEIHGDVTTPLLYDALEVLATEKGLDNLIEAIRHQE